MMKNVIKLNLYFFSEDLPQNADMFAFEEKRNYPIRTDRLAQNFQELFFRTGDMGTIHNYYYTQAPDGGV
jgi:hypothetical protein